MVISGSGMWILNSTPFSNVHGMGVCMRWRGGRERETHRQTQRERDKSPSLLVCAHVYGLMYMCMLVQSGLKLTSNVFSTMLHLIP